MKLTTHFKNMYTASSRQAQAAAKGIIRALYDSGCISREEYTPFRELFDA